MLSNISPLPHPPPPPPPKKKKKNSNFQIWILCQFVKIINLPTPSPTTLFRPPPLPALIFFRLEFCVNCYCAGTCKYQLVINGECISEFLTFTETDFKHNLHRHILTSFNLCQSAVLSFCCVF